MRQVLIGDILALARAIMDLPANQRKAAGLVVLDRAHIADKYVKRQGMLHPDWGNGSILSAALSRPGKPESFSGDLAYLEAIAVAIDAIIQWKTRRKGPA